MDWQPWKFPLVPEGFWSIPKNQQRFLTSLARERHTRRFSEWYSLTAPVMKDGGGDYLLKIHGQSIFQLLETVYPSFGWRPWRLLVAPHQFWTSSSNRSAFLDYALIFRGVLRYFQIYEMSKDDLSVWDEGRAHGFSSGYRTAIAESYSDYPWRTWRFQVAANVRLASACL